jgi:hypothetical protein
MQPLVDLAYTGLRRSLRTEGHDFPSTGVAENADDAAVFVEDA